MSCDACFLFPPSPVIHDHPKFPFNLALIGKNSGCQIEREFGMKWMTSVERSATKWRLLTSIKQCLYLPPHTVLLSFSRRQLSIVFLEVIRRHCSRRLDNSLPHLIIKTSVNGPTDSFSRIYTRGPNVTLFL